MNQPKKLPEFSKITETIAKSRRSRQELELASLQLEELILQLESDNRERRKQQLQKVLSEI
jgi:hypothetical protein